MNLLETSEPSPKLLRSSTLLLELLLFAIMNQICPIRSGSRFESLPSETLSVTWLMVPFTVLRNIILSSFQHRYSPFY